MKDTLVIIGENIKRIRIKKNISLEEISLKLSLPLKYLKEIEDGACDSDVRDILKIARFLRVELKDFFVGT